LAINQATQNADRDDLARLRKLVGNFEKAREDLEVAAMVQADNAFHNYIFDLAQNQTLKKVINDFRKRCHILRYSAWSSPDILEMVVREHRLFVDYIEAKNKPGLDELAEVHIFHAKECYLFKLRAEDALQP
jgi:DNA-binding GntR family transcriptional regulator